MKHLDISFAELSKIVEFDESRLERILRRLFVRKIFVESRPGYVAHSEVSKHLAENNELAAFLGHCAGEAFLAASRLTEAIRRQSRTEAPNEAGFNDAFGTSDPLFTYLSKNPERFDRFNLGMAGISQGGSRSAKQVVEGYDWAALGAATVVDVGAGNGHTSMALAAVYPSLKLIVQDLPDAIRAGGEILPPSLASRVEFQAHDIFKKSPAKDVNVFYLRHILHDWPLTHAILISKALVLSLNNGGRILVSDSMLVLHNARERTEQDFVKLFKQADPRSQYQRIWRKGESVAASNILEAIFMDDNAIK